MRHTLTIAAAALLAVLVLALAVPPLIDWSAWGGTLATQLGRALDARVTLGGPISVRLLPSPRFEVGALSLERPGIGLRADAADLEMALSPLLRGTVSIASARMARPRVAIDLRGRGAGSADGARAALPADVGVERIALRDASITVMTDAGVRTLDRIDVTASAESGIGPFKAEGFVRSDQRLVPFRIATGALVGGRLAVKAESDPLAGLPRSDANGTLVFDVQGPRFEGALTLTGDIAGAATGGGGVPWRARFDGNASLDSAEAKTVDLRLGDESSKFVAIGSVALARDGGVTLDLQSERPDLDRFRASVDLGALRDAVAAMVGTDRPLRARWRADAMLLGGEVASDAHVDLSRAASTAPTTVDASLSVTRDGLLSFRGTSDVQGRVNGNIVLRSADAPNLARWLRTIVPNLPTSDIPFSRVDIAGRVVKDGARTEISDLRATFDRSTLTGRASFIAASSGRAAKFEATLASPALDLDALPDLTQMPATAKGVDLAVTLDAQAVRVARVGEGTIDAGRISLALDRNGENFTVERLALENVGGATLRATARGSARTMHAEASLDARQLGEFSGLLRRIAPGTWSDAVAARAALLAPANVSLQLDAERAGGAFTPSRVAFSGKLADTNLGVTLSPNANGIAGAVLLEAPEAAPFLRQLGMSVIPLRGQGPGRIEANLSGKIGAPLTTAATATIAGATAQFDGVLHLDATAAGATGALRVNARDLGPLLRIIAAPVDAFAGWPVDLRMQLDTRGPLTLREITGSVAGNDLTGALEKRAASPWTGALRLARLDVGSLAAVLLGPPSKSPSGLSLATQKFAPQPNDPLAAEIDLDVARVMFPGGTGGKTSGRLTIGPGAIGVNDLSAEIAGGKLSGSATLRRQEDTASLAAKLVADNLGIARPWGAATLSGDVDVAGAGTSPAGLAGTLAGKGNIRVDGASLARTDPDAPLRVATAVDAERIDLDPATIKTALALAFDAAPQALPTFAQPLLIEAGIIGFSPAELAIGTGQATFAARYDLARDRLDISETLQPKAPADWSGPPPRVDIALAGPSSAPVRTIDAMELISTLAAHGLAREEALRRAIDADRRERAFFNRRLRFERAGDAERRAEQAKLEAERQAKLEAERQARLEAERQAEVLRQEQLQRETARQREAERVLRERQRIERLPPMPNAPLELRPPAAFVPGRTPSIIAPDPGSNGRY